MPLCPHPWSTCLPVFWPVALEGAGMCHPAACLGELLQGTWPQQRCWLHGSVALWVAGALGTCYRRTLCQAGRSSQKGLGMRTEVGVGPSTAIHSISWSAVCGEFTQKGSCLSPSYVSEPWGSILACQLTDNFLCLSFLFYKIGITYFKGLLGGANTLKQAPVPAT